ncbi:MAG: C1 family peptidase [Bacteroidetes bacterium]|nr:C1 family peptidase [Bacteroidota bacterium]
MPIRMVKDDPNGSQKSSGNRRSSRNSNRSGASGAGGNIGNLIGVFLPFLLKRPKLLIALMVIAIAGYFYLNRSSSGESVQNAFSQFVRGGELDKNIYEESEIYEALADNKKKPLPEKVSLQEFCPTPLNQGKQGSCVAWASAYAARTILEARKTGKEPNSIRFSPSFLYNQIALKDCQGSYVKYAMDNMMQKGGVPFSDFAYDDSDCSRTASASLKQKATQFKIKGFQRLTEEKRGKNYEILAMKQNLAKGSPVVIGMMVGGSFMSNMLNRDTWFPIDSDYDKNGFGGHAMCVVGYDDYWEGGSFLLMNSWGKEWGKGGFAWIRYSDFRDFNVEAYGLYPMGNAKEEKVDLFKGTFGLELNSGKKSIALVQTSENTFESAMKLSSTDKFKVEFTNNSACYTYLFGEEKDLSSYVLFPYTPKHSPYCGITGTRLFPRDYSMVPDKIGNRDRIAVVISFEPLDYDAINKKINTSNGASYEQKLKDALSSDQTVIFKQSGSSISFAQSITKLNPIYFVIEIKK